MYAADGGVRPHYRRLSERLGSLSVPEFERRRAAVDLAFLRRGVTFTVYNDAEGTERIFPFDLIPRIIPAQEWSRHRGRPGPENHRAQPLPPRPVPRAEDPEGQGRPGRAGPQREAFPARVHELLGSARHLRPHLRHRPDTRPRRELPGPGGQPALPVRGLVHDREPRGHAARVSEPVPELRRPAGRGLLGRAPQGAAPHRPDPERQAERGPAHARASSTAPTSSTASWPGRWGSRSSRAATSSSRTPASTCARPRACCPST